MNAQQIIARCAEDALGAIRSIPETTETWRELRAAASSVARIAREAAALGEPEADDHTGEDL